MGVTVDLTLSLTVPRGRGLQKRPGQVGQWLSQARAAASSLAGEAKPGPSPSPTSLLSQERKQWEGGTEAFAPQALGGKPAEVGGFPAGGEIADKEAVQSTDLGAVKGTHTTIPHRVPGQCPRLSQSSGYRGNKLDPATERQHCAACWEL